MKKLGIYAFYSEKTGTKIDDEQPLPWSMVGKFYREKMKEQHPDTLRNDEASESRIERGTKEFQKLGN